MLFPNALRALLVVAALGSALAAGDASAAPTAKEKAEAKILWTKGKRLGAQKKHGEAADAFRAANDLDPKAQYQLDLARALAEVGSLREASDLAGKVTETKEPNTQKAKAVAAKLKQDLDARIPTLKVLVVGSTDASATVTVDGQTIETGKDVPFDPGMYTIVGRTIGGPEARENVVLAEKDRKTIKLKLAPTAPEAPKDETSGGGGTMVPAAICYAAGGAGLVVGAVLGVLAFQKTSEVEELCGGKTCPKKYSGEVATAQDYGTGSTVAFAVGGLGVVAGIILTFTVGMDDGGGDKGEEKKAKVRPVVGPGYVGVGGVF